MTTENTTGGESQATTGKVEKRETAPAKPAKGKAGRPAGKGKAPAPPAGRPSAEEITAKREAARAASQAEASTAAVEERKGKEKQLDTLQQQIDAMQEKMDRLTEKASILAQQVDRPDQVPVTIKIRSRSLNAPKAAARLADIWPEDGLRPVPSVVKSKTFRVTPVGKNASDMPTIDVENCEDEGAAKAAYYRHIGGKYSVPVKVGLISVDEYKNTEIEEAAGPAGAVA